MTCIDPPCDIKAVEIGTQGFVGTYDLPKPDDNKRRRLSQEGFNATAEAR